MWGVLFLLSLQEKNTRIKNPGVGSWLGDFHGVSWCSYAFWLLIRSMLNIKELAPTRKHPFFMNGRPTPKKPPTQIKTQFAQTTSEQFVQAVPPFPCKTSRKRQKSLCKLFAKTVFIWVGGFSGGLPSLEFWPHPPKVYVRLEAQQRYFAYRAILVAIALRNSFALVL